jgi:hypothetical protein
MLYFAKRKFHPDTPDSAPECSLSEGNLVKGHALLKLLEDKGFESHPWQRWLRKKSPFKFGGLTALTS